ncbi:unnamed protein product [Ilex paraguariensis]|uniref:Uncharacterized protein n=1 Tax=Ilex paraguariensis TaxID=185542 RepID=A0ABC8V2P2_9AQUA
MPEVYYGDAICREKVGLLLTEMGFSEWLIPLQNIEEFRYERKTGFVWIRQRQKGVHRIEDIGGRLIWFDYVITAYVSPKKVTQLTGVQAKQFIFWFILSEIYMDNPSPGQITIRTRSGNTVSFTL